MRISEILAKLDAFQSSSLPQWDESSNQWRNVIQGRETLTRLGEIPGLDTYYERIKSGPFWSAPTDNLDAFEGAEATRTTLHQMQVAIHLLRRFAASQAPRVDGKTIAILLPPRDDFQSVIDTEATIQKAIGQAIYGIKNATLRVAGWETGSLWLHLYLGSATAVALVGSIVWAAAVVRKKWIEGNLLLQQVKSYEVKNEFAEHLATQVKQASKAVLDAETAAICDKYLKGVDDPERFQRMRYAVETVSNLLMEGAEIHPSLQAPEEAKNLFPDFKALDTVLSRIPQLTEAAESSGNDKTS